MTPARHLLRSALRPADTLASAASSWGTRAASAAALGASADHATTILRICVITKCSVASILHRRLRTNGVGRGHVFAIAFPARLPKADGKAAVRCARCALVRSSRM